MLAENIFCMCLILGAVLGSYYAYKLANTNGEYEPCWVKEEFWK